MPRRRASPTPTQDDVALFRDAVGPVRPVESDRAEPRRTPPPPRAAQREADDRAVLDTLRTAPLAALDPGEDWSYAAPGVDARILRKLGRGEFAVRDELDLHAMDASTAERAVAQFLGEAAREGRMCVRIIPGKGLRSGPEGPVLRRVLDGILRHRKDVVAFRAARTGEGGSGAVIVLLRSKR